MTTDIRGICYVDTRDEIFAKKVLDALLNNDLFDQMTGELICGVFWVSGQEAMK